MIEFAWRSGANRGINLAHLGFLTGLSKRSTNMKDFKVFRIHLNPGLVCSALLSGLCYGHSVKSQANVCIKQTGKLGLDSMSGEGALWQEAVKCQRETRGQKNNV